MYCSAVGIAVVRMSLATNVDIGRSDMCRGLLLLILAGWSNCILFRFAVLLLCNLPGVPVCVGGLWMKPFVVVVMHDDVSKEQ